MNLFQFSFLHARFSHTGIMVFVILLTIYSCKPDEDGAPSDVGYDYFPTEITRWMHYDVDSTVWDDFTGEIYQYNSQILEVTESSFFTSDGQMHYRLERYYRNDDTSQWVIKDVWQFSKTSQSVQRSEENIRFFKLSFPIKANNTWDGNALNYLPSETYSYEDIHQSAMVGQQFYDSTVTVWHKNNINLIEEDIRYEVYAKHVGMIKKYSKIVRKKIEQPGVISGGVLIEYRLRSYGP
jgi:hypothetical protein